MEKLVVLWKSNNLIDILEMITPYILVSQRNGWWDEVEVIIWGASQEIVAHNDEVRSRVKMMVNRKIKVHACLKCAEDLDVVERLKSLGIDVHYSGELLTEILKSDAKLITL